MLIIYTKSPQCQWGTQHGASAIYRWLQGFLSFLFFRGKAWWVFNWLPLPASQTPIHLIETYCTSEEETSAVAKDTSPSERGKVKNRLGHKPQKKNFFLLLSFCVWTDMLMFPWHMQSEVKFTLRSGGVNIEEVWPSSIRDSLNLLSSFWESSVSFKYFLAQTKTLKHAHFVRNALHLANSRKAELLNFFKWYKFLEISELIYSS